MEFDASELNKLVADLGKAGPEALVLARKVIQKSSADIKRDAQVHAPRDPARPPKDPSRKVTGNLRNSITYETHLTAGGAKGEIGPTASYGVWLEEGTSQMPPRPYMGPALDRNTPPFVQAMEQIADGLL